MYHSTLKKFTIAAIFTFVLGIIIQGATISYDGKDNIAKHAFPNLYNELDSISKISIKSGFFNITLNESQKGWTVAELDNYPATQPKINSLLKEVSLMNFTQEIPYNADEYLKIRGLDSNNMSHVNIFNNKDESLANFVMGTVKLGVTGAPLGTYIRIFDEKYAYLSDSLVDISGSPLGWVDTSILNIHPSHIKVVDLKYPLSVSSNKLGDLISNLNFINVISKDKYKDDMILINKANFILKNNLEIEISYLGHKGEYYISVTPRLEGNVVTKEADNIFKHLTSRHKNWLYQIPLQKIAILAPKK